MAAKAIWFLSNQKTRLFISCWHKVNWQEVTNQDGTQVFQLEDKYELTTLAKQIISVRHFKSIADDIKYYFKIY